MHRPESCHLTSPPRVWDPLVQQEFHELVDEVRIEGRTVFLSSHVLPEVERLCDRVGIVREGRIVAIQDIGDLKARALRTLEIHFARPVTAETFSGQPGVRDVQAYGDTVRLAVVGPLDAIVKTAARFEVVGLTTHEPSLEDVFLDFYGKGDDHAG